MSKIIPFPTSITRKLKPCEEIIWKSSNGVATKEPCGHRKIPGLDADFCEVCRVWWIDAYEREKYYARKRNASAF